MEHSVEAVDKRFSRALERRRPWEGTFQECYDYALPQKTAMYDQARGQDRTPDIFDETAVVGVQEFASRLQNGLIPPYSKWSKYVPGPGIAAEESKEVMAKLEEITEYVFKVIHNSNFSQEAHEAFLEVAIGTACMWVGPGDYRSPIKCKTIPLSQLVLQEDFTGYYRKIAGRLLPVEYPNANLGEKLQKQIEEEPDKEIVCRHACWVDHAKAPEPAWQAMAWVEGDLSILEQSSYTGEGSNPYIPFRWAKTADEVWGRGPLMNALPAIKTCNLTVQMVLENAEMAIAGLYQVENDGVVNVDQIRIEPATIVPISPGSRGLQPVGAAGNFDVSQLILQDMRTNIKKALYNEMLGNPENTPASATEVSARMADLSRQIGAAYGRLHAEFVQPFLRRVLYVLREQGLITLPTVNNKVIAITPQSPLSRAQQYQEVEDIQNFMMILSQTLGPQLINIFIKGENAAPLIAQKMGIPDSIIRPKAEQEQILMAVAQQQGMSPDGQAAPAQPPAPPGG